MSAARKTAVVVCPGRGTYNKAELGYLYHHHADKNTLIEQFDAYRRAQQQPTISELDQSERFSLQQHTRGDNASALIYACAYADYLSIDQDSYDIVAISGNSMGWYISLACTDALTAADGLHLVNRMGSLMQNQAIGGQVIYPLLDQNWLPIPGRRQQLHKIMQQINRHNDCELYISIQLGGLLVFAGNYTALKRLLATLPPQPPHYPLQLPNHAAFHTPLMQPISEQGKQSLPQSLWQRPKIPLIDGRGHIWSPYSCDPAQLWDYTLSQQVIDSYNFTRAIQVSVCEFAPDCVIILGPGNTLGGAVAQSLIEITWRGIGNKQQFAEQQQSTPFVLSMGLEQHRELVTAG